MVRAALARGLASDSGAVVAISSGSPRKTTSAMVSYAAARYKVAFVEDAERNGISHERFRLDVNGKDTLSYFGGTLQSEIRAGDFGWAAAG